MDSRLKFLITVSVYCLSFPRLTQPCIPVSRPTPNFIPGIIGIPEINDHPEIPVEKIQEDLMYYSLDLAYKSEKLYYKYLQLRSLGRRYRRVLESVTRHVVNVSYRESVNNYTDMLVSDYYNLSMYIQFMETIISDIPQRRLRRLVTRFENKTMKMLCKLAGALDMEGIPLPEVPPSAGDRKRRHNLTIVRDISFLNDIKEFFQSMGHGYGTFLIQNNE